MKRQAWALLISAIAAVLTLAALARADLVWAGAWGLVAVVSFGAARAWNRRSPEPFPYALRWLLLLPRPGHSPRVLKRILQPRRGEYLLEVGPGIGVHALPIASSLVPGGILAAVDLQRPMLVDLVRRADQHTITNVVSTQADATRLPYADHSFDGAYLIGVLGEIPDQAAALRELRRVVKPQGRLVIGEICVDPDFVSLRSLRAHAREAGFAFESERGSSFAYLARFRPA